MSNPSNSYAYNRQYDETKKFKDYAVFARFLKELLRHCSDELLRFRSPDDIKVLVNHNAMIPFKDILMDPNFALRWATLCDKCPETHLRPTGSMKDEAVNIKNGLIKKGSLIKHFGDFPTAPVKTPDDLKRFYRELLALQHNGKNKYTTNQRSYISHTLMVVKKKLILMNAHEQSQGNKDEPSISKKRNAEQAFGAIDSESTIAKALEDVRPREKHADIKMSVQASDESLPLESNNKKRAVDFFLLANPDLSKEEAVKKFCYLPLDVRTLFDNLEKNQKALWNEH